mmetsp:Transcript_37110/g.86718  ORF Transcript_37110/g.86718 Transcript_37110/m.86718 type:complete len:354 (+) Transcript_37110:547-1608(+)
MQQRIVRAHVRLQTETPELSPRGESAVQIPHARRRLDDSIGSLNGNRPFRLVHLLNLIVGLINKRRLLGERIDQKAKLFVGNACMLRVLNRNLEGLLRLVGLHHRHDDADHLARVQLEVGLPRHLVEGERLLGVPLLARLAQQQGDHLARLLLRVKSHHALQTAHLPFTVAQLAESFHHSLVLGEVGRPPLLLHGAQHAEGPLGLPVLETRVDVLVIGRTCRRHLMVAHLVEELLRPLVVLGGGVRGHQQIKDGLIRVNLLGEHLFKELERLHTVASPLIRPEHARIRDVRRGEVLILVHQVVHNHLGLGNRLLRRRRLNNAIERDAVARHLYLEQMLVEAEHVVVVLLSVRC